MANAAKAESVPLSEDQAREIIYGMPYGEWKSKYQTEATEQQLARYKQIGPDDTTD
jgi:hypothetical protein